MIRRCRMPRLSLCPMAEECVALCWRRAGPGLLPSVPRCSGDRDRVELIKGQARIVGLASCTQRSQLVSSNIPRTFHAAPLSSMQVSACFRFLHR